MDDNSYSSNKAYGIAVTIVIIGVLAVALSACSAAPLDPYPPEEEASPIRYSIVGYAAEGKIFGEAVTEAARESLKDGVLTNREFDYVQELVGEERNLEMQQRKEEVLNEWAD